MITVVNMYETPGRGDYIGRARPGQKPTPLGNPFKIGKDGNRNQCVERFKHWLWAIVGKAMIEHEDLTVEEVEVFGALLDLSVRHAAGENLRLLCYCAPLPCHGDVIKACLEWIAKKDLEAARRALERLRANDEKSPHPVPLPPGRGDGCVSPARTASPRKGSSAVLSSGKVTR